MATYSTHYPSAEYEYSRSADYYQPQQQGPYATNNGNAYNEEAYNYGNEAHYGGEYEHHHHNNQSVAAGNGAHKVLAERYKTKMCKKYLEYGSCPYEVRCMFAHGDHELRTAEMNHRDGLVTEDAIRHFRRMMMFKGQQEEVAGEQPPNYDETLGYLSVASPVTAAATRVAVTKAKTYRHDPYGFNPLSSDSSESEEEYVISYEEPVEEAVAPHADDCSCGDCLYERGSSAVTVAPRQQDYVYSGHYGVTKTAAYDEHAEAIMP